MAKNKEEELIKSFDLFKDVKNIDKPTLMGVLEEVLIQVLIKKYGSEAKISVVINPERGDLQIWHNRTIVADELVEDPHLQIALSKARETDPDFEEGEDFSEEIKIEDFGRRNILILKQQLDTRIKAVEKEHIYKKYKDRLGELFQGEVYQTFKKEIILLDDDGNELYLLKSDMIPKDFFKKGEPVSALICKVEFTNGNLRIFLSRTAPEFLEKLVERDVPEVFDGLITIKKVVREPGERAKMAVESYDDRIDPVGACVGPKGKRIHGVVRELRNENIDVINYTTNLQMLIQRSLSPAKINSIVLSADRKKCQVYLDQDQVSLAIGRNGTNIKLASKLCGVEIEIYREMVTLEDIDLEEFEGDIDIWVIKTLQAIGCSTARNVLALSTEELVQRTDLEEETILEVVKILKAEFE